MIFTKFWFYLGEGSSCNFFSLGRGKEKKKNPRGRLRIFVQHCRFIEGKARSRRFFGCGMVKFHGFFDFLGGRQFGKNILVGGGEQFGF